MMLLFPRLTVLLFTTQRLTWSRYIAISVGADRQLNGCVRSNLAVDQLLSCLGRHVFFRKGGIEEIKDGEVECLKEMARMPQAGDEDKQSGGGVISGLRLTLNYLGEGVVDRNPKWILAGQPRLDAYVRPED